ncbi:E3 ubiquitin-protein ligase rnf152 [Chanos chanos]|uniref:RING-type E3 ubiquitin transferase n=1 Tax=Chanos chanos TaxID=29144 RepID=A0A6J2VKV6_CHACN|nr:E3 ubiquitin-protein ligase RNF152-like [Chanos chanos]
MEAALQDSKLECQICFNGYSPRRRPKLLECQHTCCSACLTQMRLSHREIRCPWCRHVTDLSGGLSVSQLPDDAAVLSVISVPRLPEHAPVFIRLPDKTCYVLPLRTDPERALLPGNAAHGGFAPKNVAAVNVAEERIPVLGEDYREEEEEEEDASKRSIWTGLITVILVGLILLFLLGIVLHNMSCVSKRFTIITCG